MDPTQFRSKLAGEVRKQPRGYWAFIPAPLPPAIQYDVALTLLNAEAESALGELSGLARYHPNPELLIRPYVQQEALSSSRIEGTVAELSDLLRDELEPERPPSADVREVQNYIDALNHGVARLKELPISGRLIREMHAILMRGERGQHLTPGEFRRSQNWIGSPGSTLNNAKYVPPPHEPEMMDCLKHLEEFIHVRGTMPDVIQCGLIHEQFEAIHPFLDGNGRIGRLLITLFLIERGRLGKPLLYLSSFIERYKKEYYERLQGVRTHGDWRVWLDYFLAAVRDTARGAIVRADEIIRLREEYIRRYAGNARALALIEELFINPYVTVARAVGKLAVSTPTATKIIRSFANDGILELYDASKTYGRVWVARAILHAVEADEPDSVP